MNAKRLNRTNERMCIPYMDEELFVEAVKSIVQVDGPAWAWGSWCGSRENCRTFSIPPFRLFNLFLERKRFKKMCIPYMDEELFVEAVKSIVQVDADWIPHASPGPHRSP